MFLQIGDAFGNRSWQVGIIRVQPPEYLSSRKPKPFIDGVRLPVVFLGDPNKTVFIFFKNLNRVVGRSSIDHQIFQVRIILIEHAEDRLLNISALIVRGRNDRDERTWVFQRLSPMLSIPLYSPF